MKSRIAIFEGYGRPSRSYGAPIFQNSAQRIPRDAGLEGYGRRSYYVPAERAYGPVRKAGGRRPIVRAAYKVRKMKDTPGMKRAQARMKKAAKICSRKTRNSRKGSYRTCMRKQLRKGKR